MKTDELIEELEYAAVQAVISGCPLNRLNSAKEALRTAIEELHKENALLKTSLNKANAQAEHFEREWYLCMDKNETLRLDAERFRFANENEVGMNKYLITEEQRQHIDAVLDSIGASEGWVKELKPIEPLSNKDIDKLYERIDDYYNASWTHKFARDIEAHILGEKS